MRLPAGSLQLAQKNDSKDTSKELTRHKVEDYSMHVAADFLIGATNRTLHVLWAGAD